MTPLIDLIEAQSTVWTCKVAPDASVSPDSVFSDRTWRMKKTVTTPGVSGSQEFHVDDLPGYPGGFALGIAEYAYARLKNPVVSEHWEANWLTVQNEIGRARTLVEFFDSLGRYNFSEVTKADWTRLLEFLRTNPQRVRTERRIVELIETAYTIWRYSERLSQPMVKMPFGMPIEKIFDVTSLAGFKENRTACIPENIYAALLALSLDYVIRWAPSIVAPWLEVLTLWKAIESRPLSFSHQEKLLSAGAKRILSKYPAAWRSAPWVSLGDLQEELYQLRTAATIVILALSGVRPSELLSIENGCCILDVLEDGEKVWFLNTSVHKHRPGGGPDTWVVIEEVKIALEVLEKITERLRLELGDNRLFLSSGFPFAVTGKRDPSSAGVLTTAALIYQIGAFVRHGEQILNRRIPINTSVAGKSAVWRFNLRQFRRTLARHIVRQPFGVIAGMLQYKHVSVATFEGYAGVEPEWNRMVSAEQGLYDIDVLGELAMEISSGTVAGKLGSELMKEAQVEFRGQALDASASQIAKWLQGRVRNVYAGKFNLCLFNPALAECLEDRTAGRPIINACEPSECSNSCVRQEHRPLWSAQLAQTVELQRFAKKNSFQLRILKTEEQRLRQVIECLDDPDE